MTTRSIFKPARPQRRTIGLVLFTVAGLFIAYLLFIPRPRLAPLVGVLARQAQTRLMGLQTARLDEPQERDTAIDFLTARLVDSSDHQRLSDQSLRAAAQTIVEFLAARASGDPDDYALGRIPWSPHRTDWPDWPPGNHEAGYRRIATSFIDDELPSPFEPASFFHAVYAAKMRLDDGALRPAAICVGPDASEAMSIVFTHPADNFLYTDQIQGRGLGEDVWVGGLTASGRRFFDPPASLSDILQRHAEADVLRVLIVYESKTGLRVPLDFWLVHDPDRHLWHIHRLFQNNIGHTTGVGPRRAGAPLY